MNSVQEFMAFFSQTVAERTKAGQRQSVKENSENPLAINGASLPNS